MSFSVLATLMLWIYLHTGSAWISLFKGTKATSSKQYSIIYSSLFTSSWQQETGGRGKEALTWSVIKRISFKIKPNSYSVDDLMHVWCVTASGIRVLPIGPMLPSSPCLEWREGDEKADECIGKPLRRDYPVSVSECACVCVACFCCCFCYP